LPKYTSLHFTPARNLDFIFDERLTFSDQINWKSYIHCTYRMAAKATTLSDLEGHLCRLKPF